MTERICAGCKAIIPPNKVGYAGNNFQSDQFAPIPVFCSYLCCNAFSKKRKKHVYRQPKTYKNQP